MTTTIEAVASSAIPPATLTTIGLYLPPGLSFEQWQAIGPQLLAMEEQAELTMQIVRWAIGDWLAYGEHRWGEKYAQAVELTGGRWSESRLANIAWTAGAVESSRRREGLSFEHHSIVAPLPPTDQERLLVQAEADSLSTAELADLAYDVQAENDGKDRHVARAERYLAKVIGALRQVPPARRIEALLRAADALGVRDGLLGRAEGTG